MDWFWSVYNKYFINDTFSGKRKKRNLYFKQTLTVKIQNTKG